MEMKPILEEVYWDHGIMSGKECASVEEKLKEETEYFKGLIPEGERARFRALDDLYTQMQGYAEVDAFAYGLRLGAAFMAEVLSE